MSTYEKALRSRVILVAGDEDVLRREALTGLLGEAAVLPDDFDLETFAGDASNPGDWAASAGTSPFLADRRTVVVRHLLRCDVDRLKGTDLSKLPPSSLLILVADDEGGSDDRIQKAKTQRKAWEKVVNAAGGSIVACDANPKTVRDNVKKRATSLGKLMSDKAIDTLVEMTGGSLSRALDEMEKIVLFTTGQEQIRESDVRSVVVPSRDWNVFKMVDAILAGDVAEALRQLRTLVGSATKAEDAAFSRILPTVNRSLRLLWQGRLCIDAGCSPSNAPETVRAMFPDRPNLSAEQPYRQGLVMTTARRITLARLERCFAILADTDARLKGALDGFSGIETLERMVLEMAEATAPRRAA
ncbi:DNA polymerase III subunit delta [Fimbriimonas ginsengisoli]|uniref:DNA-directed DNA polymerase n=1 Tax=Fimbriimonas ginsengisoli Gsoil 348 TaxID=661478 RepID=A0A068NM38_FIMGI|nr:DNA polymerase III subunit delta [Fimbriimonas ginsengisoli]AIE83850.1 DNA polymerase III subunit delta [Fimbriimonas ginsengisoli Gsoil 348]